MSPIERIAEIKTQLIGNRGVRALIVEGQDDLDALSQFLGKRFPGWESLWVIAKAGGKRQVLKIIASEPNWIGVVDRDDWTADERADHETRHLNLCVLPRFCLESYLIDPSELWAAFPEKQRAKIPGGVTDITAALAASLPDWTRHAALWHVITPLWRKLRHLGFTDGVLDTHAIPDDQKLADFLKNWAGVLDAEKTLKEFNALLATLQAKPHAELFSQWIYAKRFYPEVVYPALDKLLGAKSAKERRQAIFRTLPVPVDLDGLWLKMGLLP
jgi:hypothetical protein